MKGFAGLLAATALIAAPVTAAAQDPGGHPGGAHGGAAGHGPGGYEGQGGYEGHGGYRPFRGPYWSGWGPYWSWWGPWAWWGPYPWFYGWPEYCDYDWPYCDYWPGYPPPPPAREQPSHPGNVCGSWVWQSDKNRYEWAPSPCGPSTPASPAAAGQ